MPIVAVEGSVVDRAHSHTIRARSAVRPRVLLDVSCVEQILLPEVAQGACRVVGGQDAPAEDRLVQTSPNFVIAY